MKVTVTTPANGSRMIQITDYVVDPVFSTINGASLKVLSAKHAFPFAWNAEQSNGSILLGMYGKKPKRKYPSKELRTSYSYDDGLEVSHLQNFSLQTLPSGTIF